MDREAEFRAYVVSARPALTRTATLLTAGDAHLAEDIVQIALTKLYLAWPRLRDRDSPDAYTRRILVNALTDERRRPFRRRESIEADVPDTASVEAEEPDFEPLHHALAELPPDMRAAVVFRHVYDLSVTDTAAAMRCSEGNVKSQTARGLERLRKALGRDLATPPTRSTP